jgi:Protein of unknown function (DUF3604)
MSRPARLEVLKNTQTVHEAAKNLDGEEQMLMPKTIFTVFSTLALGLACFAQFDRAAAQTADNAAVAAAEDAVPENPLKQAYFGETHVHTSYSLDAYIGGARLTPDDAYRFAKGETVALAGREHNIVKPLDFAAVTDHAEFIGELFSTQVEGAPGYGNPQLVELRGLSDYDEQETWFVKYVQGPARAGNLGHPPFYAGEATTKSAWQMMVDTAAKHYEPGIFTTFAGFEWTAAPNGGNMHRNVIFRDLNVPELPFDSIISNDEEKLWEWMAAQEANGAKLLAIPHNSNASKGFMFEPVDNSGNPINAEYARRRSHFEPLIEMMQIKGNSEVVSSLWPADEFADFENANSMQQFSDRGFKKESFVRWAVTKGLDYQTKLRENPYKLGFVGGTDSHNGTPSDVVEDNYAGSHGGADQTPELRREGDIPGWAAGKDANPGAVTGVWATKNTRGAIYDAMRARETFVTSGTRIKPRFFGGAALAEATDPVAMVEEGYVNGVPMGGTLSSLDGPPSFNVHAMKDPQGANLDRIQIIKGWVDENGEPKDKIFDVAWSGDRKPGADGKLPLVGNTVDLSNATYTNDIGATELAAHWTDKEFDPSAPALYYVRVIEIPTPRWTTYDAVKNGLPLLVDVPPYIQERAWTSPIWYEPD